MLAKHVGALVLMFAILMDGVLIVTLSNPWYRLALGLIVLVPIILASSSAEVTKTLWHWLGIRYKLRRYPALRSKVSAFIDEVRRLNWLVVDAERGFGDTDALTSDIEVCKQRMALLFGEIQEAAGHVSIGLEPEDEAAPAGEGEPESEKKVAAQDVAAEAT